MYLQYIFLDLNERRLPKQAVRDADENYQLCTFHIVYHLLSPYRSYSMNTVFPKVKYKKAVSVTEK